MDLYENLYENIFRRKSTRKYTDEKLNNKVLENIKDFMRKMPILDDNLRLNAHFITDGNYLYERLNVVGKIKAPHYVVITGIRNRENLINSGYAMEHLVLYLTSLGIPNCFVGMKISHYKLSQILQIKENEDCLITIALGTPEDPTTIYRKASEFKRSKLSELIPSGYPDDFAKKILEAVIVSPSSHNCEPWRFTVEKDQITLYKNKLDFIKRNMLGDIPYIDMGICLAHFKLAIQQDNKTCEIIKHKESFSENNEKIATILYK